VFEQFGSSDLNERIQPISLPPTLFSACHHLGQQEHICGFFTPVAMIRIIHVDIAGCCVKAYQRILGSEVKPNYIVVVTHGIRKSHGKLFSLVAPLPLPFWRVSTKVPSKCFKRVDGLLVIYHS
jgi:hypothetical protein